MSDVLDEMGFKVWLLLLDHVKGVRIEILSDSAFLHLCQNLRLDLGQESVNFLLLGSRIDDIRSCNIRTVALILESNRGQQNSFQGDVGRGGFGTKPNGETRVLRLHDGSIDEFNGRKVDL
jgi:hypothetical protein